MCFGGATRGPPPDAVAPQRLFPILLQTTDRLMAIPVDMPKLSDTMEEGVLVAWLADEGDQVSAGDVIAQVETDKATMDLEVFDDGVLLKKLVEEGDAVDIGALIAVLGDEGEDISPVLEEFGVGGDAANGAADAEEAEATDEAEAPDDAPATAEGAPSGDGAAQQEPVPAGDGAPEEDDGRIKASPLARRMASQNELDIATIDGSGPQGRIIKRDIEEALEAKEAAPVEEAPAEEDAAPAVEEEEQAPAYQRPGDVVSVDDEDLYEAVPLSQMRKTIARRLAESKFTAPHFYLTIDIDMEGTIAFRKQLNHLTEEQERPKVSFNDIITKACAVALRKHPDVNSAYLEKEGEIRYYNQVHVGVAVAIDEGLVTPVIRHADRKGLAQIAEETREMAGRARDRKLQPAEMEGATFTTSNLGMFGIEEFTAIINPPSACILAIGAIRDEPVVKNGEVVPGKRMKVTLSCDHRVVDGAVGSAFLNTLQQHLEEPMNLLL